MASLNKVQLIGNLGADPETKYLPSGDAVTNIRIATTERWTDKSSGEEKEATEWHRITFWGRLAEVAGEYLKKGAQVYVEGKLQTRKWQDKEGNDRYSTEIRADRMLMLGTRNGAGRRNDDEPDHTGPTRTTTRRAPATAGGQGKFDDMEDDIPF